MQKLFYASIGIIVLIIVAGFFLLNAKPTVVSKTDLDRPLVVGIVSWPGYAAGITANNGFKENTQSIFYEKYGLMVRFVLIEDIDARGKAFAKGGPDGVDVVWTTIDFWANELPNFVAGGIDGKAFMQVDWSRGGDAIVADKSISKIEDLKGKKISLVQYTPSHWLLETALRQSNLAENERQYIRNNFIFTQDAQTARAAFVAGQVDAAVVWEPDVSQALKREDSHILTSTKEMPNTIADMLVAKDEFIKSHPKAMEAFVSGWLDGVEKANDNKDLAARLLTENEPLFADIGFEKAKESLEWVYWPDLKDNARMFGLDNNPPLFDSIFTDAGKVWQSIGAIENTIDAQSAKDDSIIRILYKGS